MQTKPSRAPEIILAALLWLKYLQFNFKVDFRHCRGSGRSRTPLILPPC
jgi:hypothetical protein